MNIDPTTLVNLTSSALARILEQTATKGGVIPSDPTLDPAQVLKDLRLPQNLQQNFTPILKAFGFEMDECALDDVQGFEEARSVHRFWITSTQKLFLIPIPNWVLERNSDNDRMAVDYIRHFFQTEARVYLISEGVNFLRTAFEGNFETWRLHSRINVILIPWGKFKEMQPEAPKPTGLPPGKRQAFLKLVFKLDQLSAEGLQLAKIDLTPEERERLVGIFVSQASTSSLGFKGYFASLIKSSNLPENWQMERIAAMGGNPNDDATDLINWALKMGRNTKRESHSVLAEILEVLIESVGSENQTFIKQLVLGKPLLFDEKARKDFRDKY